MKTHILLVIDGVVNALARSIVSQDTTGTWKTGKASGYTISWNTQVIDYLNNLIAENHLVVLSTWRQDAIDIIFPLVGLNVPEEHTVLDKDTTPESFTHVSNKNYWWKRKFALDFFEENSGDRFVWIDDDHGYYPDYLNQEGPYNQNLIKICPDPFYGIAAKEMKQIDDFIGRINV